MKIIFIVNNTNYFIYYPYYNSCCNVTMGIHWLYHINTNINLIYVVIIPIRLSNLKLVYIIVFSFNSVWCTKPHFVFQWSSLKRMLLTNQMILHMNILFLPIVFCPHVLSVWWGFHLFEIHTSKSFFFFHTGIKITNIFVFVPSQTMYFIHWLLMPH